MTMTLAALEHLVRLHRGGLEDLTCLNSSDHELLENELLAVM
jgi:hypothetical protein